MNPFYIEQKRKDLINLLAASSGRIKLFKILDFYSELISSKNEQLIAAYQDEFKIELVIELKKFHCQGLPPTQTQKIIDQLKEITANSIIVDKHSELTTELERIEADLDNQREFLYGSNNIHNKNKIQFPVLEIEADNKFSCGLLESVTIIINKSKNEDKFILVPSDKKINEQFLEQIKTSFRLALEFLGNNKIFSTYHEVIIYFHNKEANFEGSSHGVALAIGFIEKLCDLYNLPIKISLRDNISLTGSLKIDGKILGFGSDIIEKKIETVFYSPIEFFIISKQDESAAQKKFEELKTSYTQRALKIIAIENLSELFNYRKIVDIYKLSLSARTLKTVKRNWFLLTIIFLLFSTLFVKLYREFDNNPFSYERNGNTIFVKSKTGNIVTQLPIFYDSLNYNSLTSLKTILKIVDINNDDENEIITAGVVPSVENEPNRIACRDKELNVIWEYVFRDTISSKLEILKPFYGHKIIDTCTINNQKLLAAIATNSPSYSSSIFFLDYKTGLRVGPTFWHQGHIVEGIITDYNNDKKQELLFTAFNNGFEKIAFAILPLDNIIGQSPSTEKYMFYNREIADFKIYILFPNTDYNQYLNERYMISTPGSLNYFKQRSSISMTLYNRNYPPFGGLEITLDNNLLDADIIIGSDFRVLRDTLVAKGKLKLPTTDTPEYAEQYKNKIQFWNGSKFIFYNEWIKNRFK